MPCIFVQNIPLPTFDSINISHGDIWYAIRIFWAVSGHNPPYQACALIRGRQFFRLTAKISFFS
jgi:hypothetical protein